MRRCIFWTSTPSHWINSRLRVFNSYFLRAVEEQLHPRPWKRICVSGRNADAKEASPGKSPLPTQTTPGLRPDHTSTTSFCTFHLFWRRSGLLVAHPSLSPALLAVLQAVTCLLPEQPNLLEHGLTPTLRILPLLPINIAIQRAAFEALHPSAPSRDLPRYYHCTQLRRQEHFWAT